MITILLAKVFGLYLIIGGIAILMRQRQLMLAIAAFVEERFARLVIAVIDLIGGLLVVNIHNDWSSLPSSLISLIGWAMVLKGVFVLWLPEAKVEKLVHKVNKRSWYLIDGILAIIIGAYLAAFGFGWLAM